MKIFYKRKLKILLGLVSIFCMAISLINIKHTNAYENKIKSCDNYIIYYGYKFNSTVVNKLKTYDLVVINPLEADADKVRKELQSEGIKVYGYSSSVEIPTYDSEFIELIADKEKLVVDGKVLNHWESNELGDLRIKSYRKKIINLIGSRIVDGGYDGVFIDTLDDLDHIGYILNENKVKVSNLEKYEEEVQNSGVTFIKELKDKYSDLSIIQNRGFKVLDKNKYSNVDAVLYEDICRSLDVPYYESIKKVLDKYTSDKGGVVMALPNNEKYYSESFEIAKENNWLYYEITDYSSTSIKDGKQYRIDIDKSDDSAADDDIDMPDNNTGNGGDLDNSTGSGSEETPDNNKPGNNESESDTDIPSKDDSNIENTPDSNIPGGDNADSGNSTGSDDKKEENDNESADDTITDTMTEKERLEAEKIAVTKVKANLSPLTLGTVSKDITEDDIREVLMDGVRDEIIELSFENIVDKGVSRSFKIVVTRPLDDSVITRISAKLIYE